MNHPSITNGQGMLNFLQNCKESTFSRVQVESKSCMLNGQDLSLAGLEYESKGLWLEFES